MSAMSPAMTPTSAVSTMSSSGASGPILPAPVTVNVPPDSRIEPGRGPFSSAPPSRPICSPRQVPAEASCTLSKIAVASVDRNPTDEAPPPREV
jgi:hypothetical protein